MKRKLNKQQKLSNHSSRLSKPKQKARTRSSLKPKVRKPKKFWKPNLKRDQIKRRRQRLRLRKQQEQEQQQLTCSLIQQAA